MNREFHTDIRSALGVDQASRPFQLMSFNDAPTSLLSPRFIGRERELSDMDSFFAADSDRQLRRLSIYGMYGVGKTQLVLQFASKVFLQKYQMVFWIASNTVEKTNQGLPKILNLIGHVDRHHPEQLARLVAARRWLEDYRSPPDKRGWLLIVDNVRKETVPFLREHLPRSSTGGDVIFTTREDTVAEALSESAICEHKSLQLQSPSRSDSAMLLLKGSGLQTDSISEDTMVQAKALASRLGCLPLAIDNASAFMRQRRMSLNGLVELYDSDQRSEFIKWQNELSSHEQASIVRTFNLQLEELNKTSPAARELLNVLSFLDISGIPLTLILTHAQQYLSTLDTKASPPAASKSHSRLRSLSQSIRLKKRGRDGAMMSIDEQDITTAIRSLINLPRQLREALLRLQTSALLEIQADGTTYTAHLHDLVQYMVHQDLTTHHQMDEFFKCAAAVCCYGFEKVSQHTSTTWSDCEPFIPHIQALSKFCTEKNRRATRINLANVAVAKYLRVRGRYTEAEELFQRAFEHNRDEFGDKDERTFQAVHDIASVQKRQGKYQAAEALLRKLLRQQSSTLGRDAAATLYTAQTLSGILLEAGKGEEAVELSNLTLERALKGLGNGHADTLRIRQNLALLYERLGEFDQAIDHYKIVQALREKKLGSDNIDTQRTRRNLAVAYSRKGNFTEAEALFRQVWEWCKSNLSPLSYETLQAQQNLANACVELGNLTQAEKYYIQALGGWQTQLEPDHHETLQTMSNLAVLYEQQGKFDQAQQLYDTVLERYETRFGVYDVRVMRTVHNMGVLVERRGLYEEAVQLYERALFGREKTLGKAHPDTKRTRTRLDDLKRQMH
ncbi:TPR-like protein [Thozetella sp. PMI_491]|nr:TPR-like protein [Thozetella sp. PMI_491]